MGFPPGLLPALVKEHLRTEDNYVPLERKEVERAGIPEAAPADSYLLARLDKFHAELQVQINVSTLTRLNVTLAPQTHTMSAARSKRVLCILSTSARDVELDTTGLLIMKLSQLAAAFNICCRACLLEIAGLQDYRPGTTRADLQDDQKRQRSRASLGGKSPPQTQKPTKETPSDGSYRGTQDLQKHPSNSILF